MFIDSIVSARVPGCEAVISLSGTFEKTKIWTANLDYVSPIALREGRLLTENNVFDYDLLSGVLSGARRG